MITITEAQTQQVVDGISSSIGAITEATGQAANIAWQVAVWGTRFEGISTLVVLGLMAVFLLVSLPKVMAQIKEWEDGASHVEKGGPTIFGLGIYIIIVLALSGVLMPVLRPAVIQIAAPEYSIFKTAVEAVTSPSSCRQDNE